MRFHRTIRVRYPVAAGRLVLRTEDDWNRDVEADSVTEKGTLYTFKLRSNQPFLSYKPCLRHGQELHWACGFNQLMLLGEPDRQIIQPYFIPREPVTEKLEYKRGHHLLVTLPAGYTENSLARYPVVFSPRPAEPWPPWLWVTVPAFDRIEEFQELVEGHYRTQQGRTALAGDESAFRVAWQKPRLFRAVSCQDTQFELADVERVYDENPRALAFHLHGSDGWTKALALALSQRGHELWPDLSELSY